MLLHDHQDFDDLLAVVSREQAIDPGLVEKDYWIMHALWGLQQLGFRFELKGGTSLSKGHGLIHRFSEDIDILIYPDLDDLPTGKNQNKPAHIEARRTFYDGLSAKIAIPGISEVERDDAFDDQRMRSAGIRLHYTPRNPLPEGVKDGILLEAGFDQVAPNRPCRISSWAYDKAAATDLPDLTDNRAFDVPCYEPGYTLVEKFQTISTKFRRHLEDGSMPQNFLRHYYDVYCLLGDADVQAFIGHHSFFRGRPRTSEKWLISGTFCAKTVRSNPGGCGINRNNGGISEGIVLRPFAGRYPNEHPLRYDRCQRQATGPRL